MKKNIVKIFSIVTLGTVLFSCEPEMANQDVSAIGSQSYKPTLTVTSDLVGNIVNEDESVTFTLTTDKILAYNVSYKVILESGTASEDDVVLSTGTIARNTNSTTLTVSFPNDSYFEADETAVLKVVADGVASEFWVLNYDSLPAFNYTIKDFVNPDDFVVQLEWDYEAASDLDMFCFKSPATSWDSAATGATPEYKNLIWGANPNGTYYLGIDPFDVEPGVTSIDYKYTLRSPNGSVTVIEGTFDYANRDTAYTTATYAPGTTGATTVYLLVQVVKTGTTFVSTSL
jgi:hypothetical protein